MKKLTITDEINGTIIKDSIVKYASQIEDSIKSDVIGYLLDTRINGYSSRSTSFSINIGTSDVINDDIDLVSLSLYNNIFEMLLWELIEEKLHQAIKFHKISIKFSEFFSHKLYEKQEGSDSGYTKKHERKEVSQKITIATAYKLMEANYIPRFECCVRIGMQYYAKINYNLRSIQNMATDFICNVVAWGEPYGGKESHPDEITYEKFMDYCKDNKFVKLLKYFGYELDKDMFLKIRKEAHNLLFNKALKIETENIFDIGSIKNNMFVDVVGTNLKGEIIYIIENTDCNITERWGKLKKFFKLSHYKFVQASSKPIKNLPNFVENWIFNKETEEMDVITNQNHKPFEKVN